MISSPVFESTSPVGSSARITPGRFASARAIETRCRSPPESFVAIDRRRWPSPTWFRSSSARARRSDFPVPSAIIGISTFSTEVSCGSRLCSWKMNPTSRARTPSRSRSVASDLPLRKISPAVGRSSAPIMCSSVDFPDPLGPTMQWNAPFGTSIETPCSALIAPPSYSFTRFTARIMKSLTLFSLLSSWSSLLCCFLLFFLFFLFLSLPTRTSAPRSDSASRP